MTIAGIVVAAVCLVLVAPVIATVGYTAILLRQYAKAIAGGYGVGKNPNAAKVRRPEGKRTKDQEPAYEHYLFGQAWRDIRHVHLLGLRSLRDTIKSSWQQIHEKHFTTDWKQVHEKHVKAGRNQLHEQHFGVAQGPMVRGTVHVLGGLAALLVTGVVLLLAMLTSVLSLVLLLGASLVALYLLRLFDTTILRIRGVTITCKSCGRRVPYAHYSCEGCQTLHGNLRPGRYGMTHRTCGCGKRFPSLMVLKSYELKSWCPECGRELAERTGMTAEIVLPVFGAPSAGKSQLIIVLIIAVKTMVERAEGTFGYADSGTDAEITAAIRMLTTRNQTEKTKPGNKSTLVRPAYSMHVAPGKGQPKLLHVFDAAGEIFASGKQIQELEYFKSARTFIFVVDPLSITKLWRTFDAQQQKSLNDRRAQQEPHVTFAETVATMAAMGIRMDRIHLAVAVSKADLIRRVLDGIDTADTLAIKAWLRDDMAQGNLIRAMDHTFKDVSFFLTSALADEHNEAHHSIEKFAEKTLTAEGLRL